MRGVAEVLGAPTEAVPELSANRHEETDGHA
jgi:hypothetical protein